MRRFAVLCVFLLGPTSAFCQTVKVEILSAEESHWTTTWNDPGSSGTQSTNCTTTDSSVNCTTTTSGARPASSTPINHTRVDILVKMPDGNQVRMQCHFPPIWATCFKPTLGTYQAKVDKHEIRVLYQTQERPEYNKDGTLKKAGKVKGEWMKFSFE